MKPFYNIILCFCIFTLLSACHKDNVNPAATIEGKWSVLNVSASSKNVNTGIVKDSTYYLNTDKTNDYIQFDKDGTATISSSGDFTGNGKTITTDGVGKPIISIGVYTYNVTGNTLNLTYTGLTQFTYSTQGTFSETITRDGDNSMLLHRVYNNGTYITTTDTVYIRLAPGQSIHYTF